MTAFTVNLLIDPRLANFILIYPGVIPEGVDVVRGVPDGVIFLREDQVYQRAVLFAQGAG